MTPSTAPVGERTGKCLKPLSSMSNNTSPARRSAGTVSAGAVIASDTGVSGERPTARTRERRSRSVRMPSDEPRSTTTAVAPRALISRAASRIEVSGGQITAGERSRAPTGWARWFLSTSVALPWRIP